MYQQEQILVVENCTDISADPIVHCFARNDISMSVTTTKLLTCSPSTEGRVSVITLDVSAIFLFLPLLFAVSDGFSCILQKQRSSW